ncbi:FadR/GntR family transcriptional regulator [Larsenimonas suaedae]|uniref:FCD domain-containing protein n=1 Tax=Larsenimonas suaedae TaxID=1851019 RepID=A0ABU1GS39_9GAMM|nr:FCD domain-containing protein [Larsenimonas suaedae]MCM2972363.1 FCD domain-containing protein [Larsenimonas suaedae]MDR5894841.1 FCD domain-containing protein [Larsenimonas suaedae]
MPDTPDSPDIAEWLVSEIFAGRFQPGAFIPRELDLCTRYGLGRTVVRKHLAVLADNGIIARISGHGSRVQPWHEWNILDPTVTQWIARYAGPNQELLREILTFRLSVEPFVAMTAAREANAHDLVAIEEAWQALSDHFKRSEGETDHHLHSEHDVAFHVAIYKATHNVVWSRLSHVLRPSITLLVQESNLSTRSPAESLEQHRCLMEAIRVRDPARAFQAAQTVLSATADALGLEMSEAAATPLTPGFTAG